MIGYKSAKSGEIRVVITFEIPKDAITNMDRSNIKDEDKTKAFYRCNKIKVLRIEDDSCKEYDSATSCFYQDKSLTYLTGNMLNVKNYNKYIDIYGTGIHYFLDKQVASNYGRVIYNGIYQTWHDNGKKEIECNFVNGKKNGLYQEWHKNGEIYRKSNYVNGEIDGLFQQWYSNGQIETECSYMNGKKHGLYQNWYNNGVKQLDYNYVNGEITS